MPSDSLLTFPCIFPIKIIGKTDPAFEGAVMGIIRKHTPDLGEAAVVENYSKQGKYLAITVNVNATSQEQLDAIYRELTGHELVIMVF